MRRREFITFLGGATAWPLAARGQQPALPVIGFLSARTAESDVALLAAFREGLGAAGYVENRNVAIQYRFADGQYARLPTMVAELVRLPVAVIITAGVNPATAMEATTKIPIVFSTASDPVKAGLVASLSRPGGNITGVTNLNAVVVPKLLELLHQLVPAASVIGILFNPTNFVPEESLLQDLQAPARSLGVQLRVLHASIERELETAVAGAADAGAGALMIGTDPFFTSRSEQLAALTLRHRVPAIYQFRQFAEAGGLISYGGSVTDMYRQAGGYAGRILKGEKPADLPVQQSTKIEMIINLKTAKALGLDVPLALLTRADEVIE